MGVLIGFVAAFLGASVFNIAGGVPLLPLQTLWVNFTTHISQAIGLGYGTPAGDLMRRRPRPVDEPILPRRQLAWLALVGVWLGGGTLGVLAWATAAHGTAVGRTMALTTFSLLSIVFSATVRADGRAVLSHDLLADRRFVVSSEISLAATVLATELGFLRKVLETVSLSLNQWIISVAVAASVLLLSGGRRAVAGRRRWRSATGR
jgi:P-type Ca2+ transporter type 2C